MAANKRGRSAKSAPRKAAAPPPRRRKGLLLGAAVFLFFGGGAAGIGMAEKHADSIPFYQSLRSKAYTLRDILFHVEDRTITVSSPLDAAASPYDNLRLGVPKMTDVVLDRRGYALGYSEQHEQPLWVAYTLTADEVRKKTASRTDDFRVDPYISTGSARQEDYAKSGFDRGHLAPAADMAWSSKTMSESFYFSNMSPQNPDFNRGIWRLLEEKVRDWAVDHGTLHIVTGPVFDPDPKSIGANRVTIPHAYYKVIYAPNAKPPAMLGFVLPNAGSKRPLADFAVTVDAVEAMTGLDFFSILNSDLEGKSDTSVWKWTPNRR